MNITIISWITGAALAMGSATGAETDRKTDVFNLREALGKASFVEKDGKAALGELEGKKLIGFYFTAKWCAPCRAFTPKLVKFRNEHPEDFQFVMMSWDKSLDEQKAYLEHAKMEVPAVRFDDPLVQEANQRFRIQGIPTLVLFDGEGKLITASAREHLIMPFHPDDLAALGDSEGAALWRKMISPAQAELGAEREKELAEMAPVFDKYRHFPHLETIRGIYGYSGKSREIEDAVAQMGRDIVADWEGKKQLLDEYPALAAELKPNRKGYRGVLEVRSGVLFDELGKAAVENPEILDKLWEMMKVNSGWALRGIVNAAVAGNEDAYAKVAAYPEHFKVSNAPLKIFPAMSSACRAGNDRALELAHKVYLQEPYYVYAAWPVLMPAANKGNVVALNAMADITKCGKDDYEAVAHEVINRAAEEGSERAKEIQKELKAAGKDEKKVVKP